jgi:hypothetical protein
MTSKHTHTRLLLQIFHLLAPLTVMFLAPTAPDTAALPTPLPSFMLFVFQFSGLNSACNSRAVPRLCLASCCTLHLPLPYACQALVAHVSSSWSAARRVRSTQASLPVVWVGMAAGAATHSPVSPSQSKYKMSTHTHRYCTSVAPGNVRSCEHEAVSGRYGSKMATYVSKCGVVPVATFT